MVNHIYLLSTAMNQFKELSKYEKLDAKSKEVKFYYQLQIVETMIKL